RLLRDAGLQGGGGGGPEGEERVAFERGHHQCHGRREGTVARRSRPHAQGPHRRADLLPGPHHAQEQVRLPDARHGRHDVFGAIAEAAGRGLLEVDRDGADKTVEPGSDPKPSNYENRGLTPCPPSSTSSSAASSTPPFFFWWPPGCSSCSACRRS